MHSEAVAVFFTAFPASFGRLVMLLACNFCVKQLHPCCADDVDSHKRVFRIEPKELAQGRNNALEIGSGCYHADGISVQVYSGQTLRPFIGHGEKRLVPFREHQTVGTPSDGISHQQTLPSSITLQRSVHLLWGEFAAYKSMRRSHT